MLNRLALFLKKHLTLVRAIQWGMVVFYISLLFSPLLRFFIPIQKETSETFALFIFWKVGWPLILILTLLLGRIWCGFFCPEGTLTEFFSQIGQKRSIPRWIRWPFWPYITTMLYFSGIVLGDIPREFNLLFAIFSLLTLLAILTGFLYGQGHRIWCMYLCPTNTLWKIISKLSLVAFQVNVKEWSVYQGPKEKIHCPTLINMKQMKSPSNCHMCMRCANYHNAITLERHFSITELSLPTSKHDATLLLILHVISYLSLHSSFYKRATLLETSYLEFLFFLLIFLILIHVLVSFFVFLTSHTIRTSNWSQLILGLSPFCAIGFLLSAILPLNAYVHSTDYLGILAFIPYGLIFLAWIFSMRLGWHMIFKKKILKNILGLFFYTLSTSSFALCWLIALLWIV